jgi:hypothetical protein
MKKKFFLMILGAGIVFGAAFASRFGVVPPKSFGILPPRTGQEIYDSLFEKPYYNCVRILHAQEIPSYDIRLLSFETCPKELKRILARHEFTSGTEPTKGWTETIPLADDVSWFVPQSMGDTIHICEFSTHESRNIQTFWISLDSTKAFCRDYGNLKVLPKRVTRVPFKNKIKKKTRN